MGVARIFQRGGHTDSYIGYSPNCHLNIVGCLLTKRLTKGESRAPQDPPPRLRPCHTVFSTGTELRKHLYLSLKQLATLSVFKQQLKRLAYRKTAGPVVATATVATTICVKAPEYSKDMLVRAKLQFEGFDNATQPQKPHWESVRPV